MNKSLTCIIKLTAINLQSRWVSSGDGLEIPSLGSTTYFPRNKSIESYMCIARSVSKVIDNNGLFLSCLLHPCQNESSCNTILTKLCFTYVLIFMQIKIILVWIVSHEDLFRNRGKRQLWNLWPIHRIMIMKKEFAFHYETSSKIQCTCHIKDDNNTRWSLMIQALIAFPAGELKLHVHVWPLNCKLKRIIIIFIFSGRSLV